MALDKVLVSTVLDILGAMGDRGHTLDAIANDAQVRTDRTVTVQQCQQAVTFAKLQGWVADRDDEWGETRIFITTAGMNRLAQM